MKYCLYCGATMPKEAMFCSKCGKEQSKKSGRASNFTDTRHTIQSSHVSSGVNQDTNDSPVNAQQKRGTAPLVWGWILLCASFVLPIIASLISLGLGIHLQQYPERKGAGLTLTIISIIATVLLLSYGIGYYPAFFSSISASN